MEERPRRDVSDGYSWWCRNCKTRKSIREGSFFSKSKINLQKWLLIIYMWAREYPVTDVSEEAEVHIETAIDIFQWLREVCSTKLPLFLVEQMLLCRLMNLCSATNLRCNYNIVPLQ